MNTKRLFIFIGYVALSGCLNEPRFNAITLETAHISTEKIGQNLSIDEYVEFHQNVTFFREGGSDLSVRQLMSRVGDEQRNELALDALSEIHNMTAQQIARKAAKEKILLRDHYADIKKQELLSNNEFLERGVPAREIESAF